MPPALLRQPLHKGAAALRSAVLNHLPRTSPIEPATKLLSFADFRKRIPLALAQQKEFGIEGGSQEDPVMQLFQYVTR